MSNKLKKEISENNNNYKKYNEEIKEYTKKLKKYEEEYNKYSSFKKTSDKMEELVYGIVLDLVLYPGEEPSLIEKQTYKCSSNVDELKREYCDLTGFGCDKTEKTKKNETIDKL
jgi:chromosome segregation ATPase